MDDAKEEIRAKLAIEDVIGQYVQLKRAGRYFKGLSPFTHERTPSFFVTPERNIWHDFSSNQGGDIFSFIMLAEGVSFPEAMEILARQAGVDLDQYRTGRQSGKLKSQQIKMNTLAMNYFQRQLVNNPTALTYARKQRKLSPNTIVKWGVGYAPSRHQLHQLLQNHGYTKDDIKHAGLNIFADYTFNGRDPYHGGNRLMIPLRDGQGQVVGFTGRILSDNQPKYLNTPATAAYNKSQLLFGLNFAKDAIRQQNFVIVVEGNMDVMTSSQSGVENIVAVAGTALTTWHLKALGRLTNDIRFCFDADRAGIKATERAIALAGNLNLQLSVIDYATAKVKDPDELIQRDPNAWRKLAQQSVPAVEWVIARYSAIYDLNTAEGKKIITSKSLSVVNHLFDPVEREFYLKRIAELTNTSVSSLREKLDGLIDDSSLTVKRQSKTTLPTVTPRNLDYCIDVILATAWRDRTLRSILAKIPDDYLSASNNKIRAALLADNVNQIPADEIAKLELTAEKELDHATKRRELLLANITTLFSLKIQQQIDQLQADFANTFVERPDLASDINLKLTTLRKQLSLLKQSNASNDFDGLRSIW